MIVDEGQHVHCLANKFIDSGREVFCISLPHSLEKERFVAAVMNNPCAVYRCEEVEETRPHRLFVSLVFRPIEVARVSMG